MTLFSSSEQEISEVTAEPEGPVSEGPSCSSEWPTERYAGLETVSGRQNSNESVQYSVVDQTLWV